ncbi:tail fiber domain-containing protein [Chitinophaga qingshengii]|uniref:Tail fiber domain-containing protein n=1 Tax=Chitinophaga qingshengii TaxID=1569794 RepID=A0ABR7TGE8_9BACT|nr:tail fiber domain-containing protein [Chitinophaga qingshengii]MBC9929526.1 tail fiber domain-containing protein [Chitinophaga qingshengii]
MKYFYLLMVAILLVQGAHAQQIYQIRADSVRIYNVCDTAELIIENRTQGTRGFLYNKGAGRTEFRRVRLEKIGQSQIAITGQDTLDLSTLPGIGGVDTIYRNGDNITYIKRGLTYNVYAPALNVSEEAVPNTIPRRNQYGQIFATHFNTDTPIESVTPIKLFGSYDNYIRAFNAEAVRNFLGPETLQSITDRGYTLTNNIQFLSSRSDSTNGLYWGYNTDTWKIFVESFQDTPSGNLIFESRDNGDEGWIFRSWGYGDPVKTDVLSLASNRFSYMGKPVWNGWNLNRPIGQSYFSIPASDGMNADHFYQGSTFSYMSNTPYHGPLLSFGGLNGGYDCQLNASYNETNEIAFRVRNGDANIWKPWYKIWHEGNLSVAIKGTNVAIKTDNNGHLGIENWVRVGENTGLYTPSYRYLFNDSPNSWAIRAEQGVVNSVWLSLQTGEGAERGCFYADANNDIGFVNGGTHTWRLRTDAAGNAYIGGQMQATSFYQTSLRSLKKDIQPLPYAALPILKKTQVRSFRFKADTTGKVNVGFIADEVPEEISIPGRGGVDQASTVGLLVKSVQELSEQNEALQQRVMQLETLLKQLLKEKK